MHDLHESASPRLFGLRGFTHGWGRTLTVIGPAGVDDLAARLQLDDDARMEELADGRLRLTEQRAGDLDRLIQRYDIVILSRRQWQALRDTLSAPERARDPC